jgi:hypothetical protein
MVLSTVSPEKHRDRSTHPVSFWNHKWVHTIFPLATSLFLHLSILIVGICLYQAAKLVNNPNREQLIIPQSKGLERNPMAALNHSNLDLDPTRRAMQDTLKDAREDQMPDIVKTSIGSMGGLNGINDPSLDLGLNPSRTPGSGSLAIGTSSPGSIPWGTPGGGTTKVRIITSEGTGQRVIFLCDASGSMLSVFGALKTQLKQSINSLDVTQGQQFNVIFFGDGQPMPLFADGVHIANADNKKLAMDFVDAAICAGGTLPLPAIGMAMREKPDLVFVLTDGFDQIASFDDVINAFKQGNSDGKMHINTIFLQADEDPRLEAVLKQISIDGHGEFTKILKSEL